MLTFKDYQQTLAKFNITPHWDLPRWGNALAGETGEACNIIKKIDRGDFGLEEAKTALAEELADVIAYATHLATKAGINVEEAVRNKYEKVRIKWESSIKLP